MVTVTKLFWGISLLLLRLKDLIRPWTKQGPTSMDSKGKSGSSGTPQVELLYRLDHWYLNVQG